MSDDRRGTDRRSLLRGAGVAAGALATSGLAGAVAARGHARPAACDGPTETTTRTGSLTGADDAATLTYDTRTSDPCELVLELSSEDATDFDLYVTTDGRTPTTGDYDVRSRRSLTSAETLTLGADAVDAGSTLGVLVDAYTAGGSWTLEFTETATDGGGGDNQSPDASFTVGSTTVGVGETVEFDAAGSSDPDGSVSSYEWSFGDGSTATGATTSHAYDESGSYTVALTVTDDDGATDTATTELTVESSGGDCGVETETAGTDGYIWYFGDGDSYTYDTRTAAPCEVTVALDGPAESDFDLYLTTDGRTPTPDDYDARSSGPGSDESVTLSSVDGSTVVGILVSPADGYGSYELSVEELGE